MKNDKCFNYGELLTIYDGLQKILDETGENTVVRNGNSLIPFEPVKVTVLMNKVKTIGEEMATRAVGSKRE